MGRLTVEIENYRNESRMKIGKDIHVSNGWRALHTDLINNKFKVTYVNGLDNPDQPNKLETAKAELLELLLGKLQNNTITFEQLKTLIRLEHGFELTQTTRAKILAAVQGVIGTLRDRIKAIFNL